MCHYIITNGGTAQLINDLDTKVKNYTKSDFCVIFVGEEDFKSTKIYIDIV